MVVSSTGDTAGSTLGLSLLTFTIKDFVPSDLANKLGTTFALSWAMTCANDIVQGFVDPRPVPLPATLPLFVASLGSAGLVGRWRKRLKHKPA